MVRSMRMVVTEQRDRQIDNGGMLAHESTLESEGAGSDCFEFPDGAVGLDETTPRTHDRNRPHQSCWLHHQQPIETFRRSDSMAKGLLNSLVQPVLCNLAIRAIRPLLMDGWVMGVRRRGPGLILTLAIMPWTRVDRCRNQASPSENRCKARETR